MGQAWSIEFWNHIIDEDGDILQGDTDETTRVIRISTAYPKIRQKSTLVHEILHAILRVSGIKQLIKDDIEEALVIAIENGLESIIELSKYSQSVFQKPKN